MSVSVFCTSEGVMEMNDSWFIKKTPETLLQDRRLHRKGQTTKQMPNQQMSLSCRVKALFLDFSEKLEKKHKLEEAIGSQTAYSKLSMNLKSSRDKRCEKLFCCIKNIIQRMGLHIHFKEITRKHVHLFLEIFLVQINQQQLIKN